MNRTFLFKHYPLALSLSITLLQSHCCPASLEQTPASITSYDNYLTHPMNSPKPHPLFSLQSPITPNGKHCFPTDSTSSPYPPPRLNSKHHPPKPSDCPPACLLTLWISPVAYRAESRSGVGGPEI